VCRIFCIYIFYWNKKTGRLKKLNAFIETQSRKRNFNTETIHNMIKFTGESNVPFFLGRDEESVCDNKNLNDFGTTVI
jgi:hypothetical protein